MIDPGHGLGLAAALAAGLIIGLERGWRLRDAGEGARGKRAPQGSAIAARDSHSASD